MHSLGENSKVHPEWTFGSVGRSNTVSGESSGRQFDVGTPNHNGARPRLHTVSSVKRAKLWGSNLKCGLWSENCEA